jgi:hypothetical protein
MIDVLKKPLLLNLNVHELLLISMDEQHKA